MQSLKLFNNKKKVSNKNQSEFKLFYALSLAGQLGFLIVVPIAVFTFLGRYLDKHFQSSPLLLFAGIVLGILLTAYMVWRIIIPLLEKKQKK